MHPTNRFFRNLLAFSLPALLFLITGQLNAQLTVPNYTACPNQVVNVTATWNNVQITSLTLLVPGTPPTIVNLGTNPSFTISQPAIVPPVAAYTLQGTGIDNNGVTTSTVVFFLQIEQPPPLAITNQGDYCTGSTATIVAAPGGNSYSVSGTVNLGSFPTNVILVPNLTAAHSGTYLVQSFGSCTLSGITSINVAPNPPLTVTNPTNACQDPNGYVYLQASMAGATFEWEFQSGPVGTTSAIIAVPTTPSNSGVYTVKASIQSGTLTCSKTATTSISIVQTVKPSLTASPGNALCNGEKLNLGADAGNQATGYSWIGPCNFSSGVKNPIISPVIPCHSGWYKATALFSNGMVTCSSTDSIRVDVIPTEVPKATVPTAVCQNQDVQLLASTTQSAVAWHWYGPNFTANTRTVQMNNVQQINSGPYIVTAVFGITGIARTCSVSSQAEQLQVIEVKTVQVIPSPPVCSPQNAQLAASAPGAFEFNWEGPNNQKYNGSNITVYYPTPAYSGVYTVTALFGSLKCPSSATVELNVYPTLEFDLYPLRTKCWGDTILLKGPPGADSYSWTSSTGFSASTRTVILPSLQTKDAGTYTLNVKLGPCTTRDAMELTVRAPIVWTLTPSSRTVCKGDTVVLEVGTNYDPHVSIEWNPDLYLDSKEGPRKVIVPDGTIHYNVKARDYGCENPYTIQHSFFVEVLPVPQPTLDLAVNRGCVPLTLQFNSNTVDSAALVTFDFGGLNQKIQSDSIGITHTFRDPGTYPVYVITKAYNGCTERWKYPIDIIADPLPGSDFTWSPDPATTSQEIQFTGTSTYDQITYRSWHFNGGIPVGEQVTETDLGNLIDSTNTPARYYEYFGSYPVTMITINDLGCMDTVTKVIQVIDEMTVYIPDAFTPNGDGVNDGFRVLGQGLDPTGFIMYVFNRRGGLVFTTNDIHEAWDGTYRGEVCQDGIYTYKIRIVGLNGEGRRDFVGRVALIK